MPTSDVVSVCASWRAGDIGPVRKEIIFEPLPEIPVPTDPPHDVPQRPAQEPVPAPR